MAGPKYFSKKIFFESRRTIYLFTKFKGNTSKRTYYSFCSVKVQYKMETKLENSLNNVSKTKSSLLHEHK